MSIINKFNLTLDKQPIKLQLPLIVQLGHIIEAGWVGIGNNGSTHLVLLDVKQSFDAIKF